MKPRTAFHLPADILAALDTLAKRNRRTKTAELLIALEEHLRASGVWPDPAADSCSKPRDPPKKE